MKEVQENKNTVPGNYCDWCNKKLEPHTVIAETVPFKVWFMKTREYLLSACSREHLTESINYLKWIERDNGRFYLFVFLAIIVLFGGMFLKSNLIGLGLIILGITIYIYPFGNTNVSKEGKLTISLNRLIKIARVVSIIITLIGLLALTGIIPVSK